MTGLEIKHQYHFWQYIQRDIQPPANSEAWFVCECGALKRVVTWRVVTWNEDNEGYELPFSEGEL